MAVLSPSGLTLLTPVVGIKYTVTTASSSDWSSVNNSTYFYDLTDNLVYYKDSAGIINYVYPVGSGKSVVNNTRSNIISQTPLAGTTGFATDDKKIWFYNGTTWQVQGETIELLNKAGATLVVGDIVQVSTGTNLACQYPTISGDSDLIGVVAIGGTDGSSVTIAIRGIWDVSVLLATTRENFLTNSGTTLYYGTDNGSSGTSGNFAYILESNATTTVKLVKCIIGLTGETF